MKKKYIGIFSFVLIGLSLCNTNSAFAETNVSDDNLYTVQNNALQSNKIPIPPTTPYIVNVQQLHPPFQVSLFTNNTDNERNMTTDATKAWVLFNFAPVWPKKAYVTIVEDSSNTKVFHSRLSPENNAEMLFDIGPNMFLENHDYTIYHSEKESSLGNDIGRFHVSGSQVIIQPPMLDTVKDTDTTVTGSVEPGLSVNVFMGQEGPYIATSDVNGKFSIQLPKKFDENTRIRAFATDDKGNKSEETISYVEKTSEVLAAPVIDKVYNTDKVITGSGTLGTILHLFIGEDEYRETVDGSGNFRVQLEKAYDTGTKIRAYLVDSDKNQSPETTTEVIQEDQGFSVDKIFTKDSFVTGTATVGSKIEVEINNTKARIFTGITSSNGKFSVDMKGNTYPAGTKVKVTSLMNEIELDSKEDIIFPNSPEVYNLKEGDTSIAGIAEPKAEITIITNGISYEGKADIQGEFRIAVPSLSMGQRISVKQNSNGIDSLPIELEVKVKK